VAIDAQLDPTLSAPQQEQKLEHALFKIAYWQRRAAYAAHHHRRRRKRDLREREVDLDRLTRCPLWPILVQLDLDDDPAGRWQP
jgi:hypothetical protein